MTVKKFLKEKGIEEKYLRNKNGFDILLSDYLEQYAKQEKAKLLEEVLYLDRATMLQKLRQLQK